MRLFGLEKFNGPCYIGDINLYADKNALDQKNTCGLVALFVKEDIAPDLAKAMGNKGLDVEDPEIIKDTVGELCNVIVGQFLNELRAFGYKDITISAPIKDYNDVPEGVDFPYNETKYYEITFFVKKEKTFVINVAIAPV
jgi:chemotaxis protein CheY-P-specific phosphatase CheC